MSERNDRPDNPSRGAAGLPESVVSGLVYHIIFHRDTPIRGVRRWRTDWEVVREPMFSGKAPWWQPRGDIGEFSHQARHRMLHFFKNCDCTFLSMLTITYPSEFPRDGRQVKRDLDVLKKWLLRRFPEIRGVWFLEFQKRGAPHFHILLSFGLQDHGSCIEKVRSGQSRGQKRQVYWTCPDLEAEASAAWFRIVGSGDEKHLRAGVSWEVLESTDAAIRYAAMHAAKPKQKTVPVEFQNVGRFWGKIGKIHLVGGDFVECDAADVFRDYGINALSSRGKLKKWLYDAETKS